MSVKIERYKQYKDELNEIIHKAISDEVLNVQDKTWLVSRLYMVYLHCIDRISGLNGSYKK